MRRVLLSLVHPSVHRIERVAVSDVVRHDDALSALVVARCDCLEALLASCIPDLQLADLLVAVDGSDLEINANCRQRGIGE